MRYIVLALLFLAAAASAQPLEGPWTVLEISDSALTLLSPHIAVIDTQTLRVFYSEDAPGNCEIRTVRFNLETFQTDGLPVVIRSDTISQPLYAAAVDGENAWVVVFNRRYNSNWVDTKYLVGSPVSNREGMVGTTGQPSVPWLPSYSLADFDLTSRVGGGWILTWIQLTMSGPYLEPSSEIFVAGLCADSLVYRQQVIPMQYQLFGPNYASTVSLTPDSSIVLTEPLWGLMMEPYCSLLLRAVAGADSETLDTICTYENWIQVQQFRRAADESLLAYTITNGLLRVNTTRGCEALGGFSTSYPPMELDFRQGYGFAGIWIDQSGIKLGRMDEDGTARDPGVFIARDSLRTIRAASVAVAPDGWVYVLWTEGTDASSRLMLARIHWDTPLANTESQFTPHPSSFTLSTFPNPFNSTLRVSYKLPHAQAIELAVFNVLGQNVETLFSGPCAAGMHEAVWTPHTAGGIYFVTLRSAESVRTQKVLYLR